MAMSAVDICIVCRRWKLLCIEIFLLSVALEPAGQKCPAALRL